MKVFGRLLITVTIVFIVIINLNAQGLIINELMSSNFSVIYDEDGDSPDWIEILNSGNTAVNLADYYLSDNTSELLKWQMPETDLLPGNSFLVFASGKDRQQLPNFWYTIIDINQAWRYLIPTNEPSFLWKTEPYNDSGWKIGNSGIGYGDGDDNTVIPNGTMSVFMRKEFTLKELDQIETLLLHMDFDDGFIAYLNNTEICRSGLGTAGTPISYNQSSYSHEAKMYQGGIPDVFDITEYIPLLKESGNLLAIQVHNTGTGSSDFSAIPFLSLGYQKQIDLNAPVSKKLSLPTFYPHTNFKLSADGETLILTNKNGTVADSVTYDIIPGNYSFGRSFSEPQKWGYFKEPTPNLPNETEFLTDVVKGEIEFSNSEMFVAPGTYVGIRGALSGENIRYTTDLSEPTSESYIFQNGIEISKNTVIRARIFKPGAISGKEVSQTFLIDEKPTLPVVALSTSPENLWDDETGIYVLGNSYTNENPYFGANFWEDWEKPAGIEMVDSDGQPMFSMNCGIKIFGAWSRAHPQKSLAIFFRKGYGDESVKDIQLFDAKPITEFKSLVLRNSGNDFSSTGFRDGMMTSLVSDMDNDVAAFQPVVLYLNGEYWGHMNLREKINEDYIESNYQIKADEIDLLETSGVVLEGDNDHYTEMFNIISGHNMSDDANYETVAGKMDISNFIDYQLSEIYFDNGDWPGNNIKFWHPQTEDGKWRWLMYDTDFGFGIYKSNAYAFNTLNFATATNGPDWPNPPWSTLILRKLLENNQFRNRFINRFADMLNTTFRADAVIHHIDSIANLIEPEVQKTSAKWNTPGLNQWKGNVQSMRVFADRRVDYVRNHILQKFALPEINEVTVSVFPTYSGNAQLNSLFVSGASWKGKYFENVPVSLTANSYSGYKFNRWEVNGVNMYQEKIELNLKNATSIRLVLEETDDVGKSVVINEINYNSAEENDAGDWIELYNWGKSDIDISGWILKDDNDEHRFVIPENTILSKYGYFVFCQSTAEFTIIHPDVLNFTGNIDFGLGSSGDAIRLFNTDSILIDAVTFGSDLPWPVEPNGTGTTLELILFSSNHSSPYSWSSSLINLGTPGKRNSVTTSVGVLTENLNEKQLIVYPNPFTNQTRIKIENNTFDPMNIQIYSMDGSLVFSQLSNNDEFVWQGENSAGQKLQPGIYICKVQSGDKIFTSKIILSR